MTELEHDLRTAFERALEPLDVPPALAPSVLARARRGKVGATAAVAGAVATALVLTVAAVGALRDGPRRKPQPIAPPTSATFVAIFPGGAYGWGHSRVSVDSEAGRVCYDGVAYYATDGYLTASSPPGAPRGPAVTVATFFEDAGEAPRSGCADLDREVASNVLEEPARYFLDFWKDDQVLNAPLQPLPPADAPPVADVVCSDDGVEVLTPEVAAQPDGIHVRIDNRMSGPPKEFYLRGTEERSNQGGDIRLGINEVTHHVGPGKLYVGCFDRGDAPYYDLEGYAAFEVVDPHDLWTPADLVCGSDVRERQVETDEPVSGEIGWEFPDYDELVRRSLEGLLPGDELERPGYPATRWHFEPRTVVRDGRRIAGVYLVRKPDATWLIDVDACPGSGIGGA